MMTLANILTLFRLFLLPFMIVLFFIPTVWAAWCVLVLYAIGSLTDFLDGWVARKYNQITEFGTFMDPISDKIYVVTIMLLLIATGRIEGLWVLPVLVILIREFMVSGLREFLGPKNIKLPVTNLAKWKTASQMLALGFLIIGNVYLWASVTGLVLLVASSVLTVITGWGYLKTGFAYLTTSSTPS